MFSCYVEPMKTCPDKTPAKIVQGLYDATMSKTPCGGAGFISSSIILLLGSNLIVQFFTSKFPFF